MPYVNNTLTGNEKVLMVANSHWFFFVAALVRSIFGSLVPAVLAALAVFGFESARSCGMFDDCSSLVFPVAFGVFAVFFILFMAIAAFAPASNELALTNRKIVYKHGLFSIDAAEVRLAKVDSISVQRGVFGAIFGFGTVAVKSDGKTVISQAFISDALKFKNMIDDAVARAEDRRQGANSAEGEA